MSFRSTARSEARLTIEREADKQRVERAALALDAVVRAMDNKPSRAGHRRTAQDRQCRGLEVFPIVAALALAGALAGCFQPLYSEAAHPGLVEDLRAIEVLPIKDRIGHYLADNLTTDLNGTGQTPTPKYRLTVTVSIGTSTPTVSSLTNVATSATMTGDARFTLNKAEGGAQVLTGVANANASYDSFPTAL